jgi:hypothetical protein
MRSLTFLHESRACSPTSVLQNLAIVVDDPVGRTAPSPSPPPRTGEADVIIIIGRPNRPSSIVAPNLRTTIY